MSWYLSPSMKYLTPRREKQTLHPQFITWRETLEQGDFVPSASSRIIPDCAEGERAGVVGGGVATPKCNVNEFLINSCFGTETA